MSYSVYIQKFHQGESAAIPYADVEAILAGYGTLVDARDWIEFTPHHSNVCEVAILSGSKSTGILGISFERPASSDVLRELIFRLLALDGTCFFEQDCTYALARSDVSDDLPDELLELCESGRITIITSVDQAGL